MGREIRLVPSNWQHPRYTAQDAPYSRWIGSLKPLYDMHHDDALASWLAAFDAARADNGGEYCDSLAEWLDDHAPPKTEDYRPYRDEEATWLQVYETVSEGTPVTPAFETPDELIDYLVTNGDEWDQRRGDGGWTRANAERFVASGWAPSLVMTRDDAGVTIDEPRDGA